MEINNKIFYSIVAIIVILLLFNWRISYLEQRFDRYCVNQYNISSTCPCVRTNLQKEVNLSGFNASSIQELPYTQNSSAS